MKKLLLGILLILLIVFGGVYTLLFTPMGNGIVAGIIEDKANEMKKANFKLETFLLTTSQIDVKANIDGNSYITVQGKFALLSQSFDFTYDVQVKDLEKLNKLSGANLQGELNTKGSVKGDAKLISVKGDTDVFDSRTVYEASLVEFKPKDVLINMSNAKIEKLLYMLKQPALASGLININGTLQDMSGVITTKISKGLVNNVVVNEAYNQKLIQPLRFKGDVVTDLTPSQAVSKVDFFTTMANVFVKKAVVDLKSGSINSDYTIKVDDMSKLYDVAQMKLRGKIVLNGEVSKTAKDLIVTGNSKLFDGNLNFKLHNDEFSSTIKEVQIIKALHMLYYPEIFTSSSDLALNYNLVSKQGKLSGNLIDGRFLPNKFSYLINQFAKFDMTKEVYETVSLNSDINKDIIKSTLDMKSKLTQIVVPHSTLDNKQRTVDALIKTTINTTTFDTKVTGSLDKPDIKIDTTKLLKQKAKKRIEKELDKKLGDGAGKLLKGLFN